MRCKKSEKWISDRLGGTLSEAKARRLDVHLAGCPSCRASLKRQEKLQGAARAISAPVPVPEYWEQSLARLQAKLEAAPAPASVRPPRQAPALVPGLRWAWAGAATMLAVVAGFYLLVLRGGMPADFNQMAFDDSYGTIAERIGEDVDLQKDLETSFQMTLGEHTAGVDSEVNHLLYRPTDFLESLTDNEVQVLGAELTKVLKI
jgi:hypothetical protein